MASVIMGVLPMTSQAFNLSSKLSFALTVPPGASLFTPPLSLSTSAANSPQTPLFVYCGRGDKKTAKGKRFNHSFRNARPRNKKKGRGPPILLTPPNKDPFDDDC